MKKVGGVCSLTVILVLSFAGCGADPSLRSIEVQPAQGTAIAVAQGQAVQFKAIGHYVKSNQSTSARDITNQVTWQSNLPSVATINASGTATAVDSGVATIIASSDTLQGSSNMLVSYGAPVPYVPILAISKVGAGSGTVKETDNLGPIDCGAVCTAFYPNPSTITLTATPTGSSTFGGWSENCAPSTQGSQTTCTVTITDETTVIAIFN